MVTDDSLRYKKLVERAVSPSKEEDEAEMPVASSNQQLAPLVDVANGKDEQPGLVLFNGFYVNIEQLLLRLEQSEESRRESEQQFKLAQSQLGILLTNNCAFLNRATQINDVFF